MIYKPNRSQSAPLSTFAGKILLVLVVVGIVWWLVGTNSGKSFLEWWENQPVASKEASPGPATGAGIPDHGTAKETSREVPSKESSRGSTAKMGDYEVWEGVRLVDDRDNDGDSFTVSHAGKTHVLRLYFVDAPEKRRHQYNGDRIRYQARYFGISEEESLEVGEMARDETRKWLSKPFRVYTKGQKVFESDRIFAFVEIEDKDGPVFLSQRLVEAGLVRIYTEGAKAPDGTSEANFEKDLRAREKKARTAGHGAWGYPLETSP